MQPLTSVMVNEYSPDVKPVIVDPVCPETLPDHVKVNGGSPDVIIVVIDPSFPLKG